MQQQLKNLKPGQRVKIRKDAEKFQSFDIRGMEYMPGNSVTVKYITDDDIVETDGFWICKECIQFTNRWR